MNIYGSTPESTLSSTWAHILNHYSTLCVQPLRPTRLIPSFIC